MDLPLRDLFSVPVACATYPLDASLVAQLTAAELASVERAVDKRKIEFAAGRVAAKRALAALGVHEVELLRDAEGRPRWPSGVVGSITHTGALCAAVVARSADARAIGLDAEPDEALEPSLGETLLTERERRAMHAPLRWTFCAKEAFYKAQSPLTGVFLDFLDVEIHWESVTEASATFVADPLLHADVRELVHGGRGRLKCAAAHVLAGYELAR